MKKAGLSGEEEEKINILFWIKTNYKYDSLDNIVNHYLQRIYPHPSLLNTEERAFYFRIKSSLIKLCQQQEL